LKAFPLPVFMMETLGTLATEGRGSSSSLEWESSS
jgi:hypothetical protein